MRLGVPKEIALGEQRIALVPEVVARLVKAGHDVVVQSGAGLGLHISDADFSAVGAKIEQSSAAVWDVDVVVKVAPPTDAEVSNLRQESVLVGFLEPLTNPELARSIAGQGATALAMEAIPRISRAQSMDVLSSQATVAGYKAAIIAADLSTRFYPLLMTAAGTIPPARVLVLGAGVAGLQAIATARRLGALVSGYDVRTTVKEQIESLGAKFLELESQTKAEGEGGYARALTEDEQAEQQRQLSEKIKTFDIVISTALVPGKPAPKLITADAVAGMRAGSVIVDLAGEAGGNCELTVPGEITVTENHVTITAPLNLPSTMPEQSSQLYSRNIEALLGLMVAEDLSLKLDFEDEVIAGACIVRHGEIVSQAANSSATKQETSDSAEDSPESTSKSKASAESSDASASNTPATESTMESSTVNSGASKE